MSNTSKYFTIKSFEWLIPTGDASKILILYQIADDNRSIQHGKDLSIMINLSRNAELDLICKNTSLSKKTNQEKVIVEYVRNEIRGAIIKGLELPSEITITSYENKIPINPDIIELKIGKWDEAIIARKMGFL